MNILHVNMSLDRVTGGGTVERTLQLHKALKLTGAGSHILTLDTGDKRNQDLSSDEVTRLRCLSTRWFIPFPSFFRIKKVVEKADVIHLMNHWTMINVWVYLIAKLLRKPYIFCPAGALTIYGRSLIKKNVYQKLVGQSILNNASAVIAISPDEIQQFEALNVDRKRIYSLPNGIAESDFKHSEAALFRKKIALEEQPYILFLGRLNAIKGPDILLKAYSKVCHDFPHHLVFAGPDGGMRENLEEFIATHNLAKRVHFVDYIGGELKSSAYHGAELLVIPSRHEAMSIVALEAAISATPVLMTFNCGFSALADAGGAIEVEPIEQSLGNELKDILASKNLQNMGQKAYVFARDNYAWSIMADRFIDLCKLTQNDRS